MASQTFTIAVTDDNIEVLRYGAVYPPVTPTHNHGYCRTTRQIATGTYNVCVACLRWDTSSLGAGAVVTGAQLKLYPFYDDRADGRSLQLEWYDNTNWPIGDKDWAQDAQGDAGTFALSSLDPTSQWHTLDLATLTGVNKTGYTGMRLHITGGTPTGVNQCYAGSTSLGNPVQLVVTYTAGYQHKVLGCLPAAIAKIMGIPTASVGKFCGV
jgi:hypothetical protein